MSIDKKSLYYNDVKINFFHGIFKKSSSSICLNSLCTVYTTHPFPLLSKSERLSFNLKSKKKKKSKLIFLQISLWLKQEGKKGNCNRISTTSELAVKNWNDASRKQI